MYFTVEHGDGKSATSAVDQRADEASIVKMRQAAVNAKRDRADESCRPRHRASGSPVSNDPQSFTEFVTTVEPRPG